MSVAPSSQSESIELEKKGRTESSTSSRRKNSVTGAGWKNIKRKLSVIAVKKKDIGIAPQVFETSSDDSDETDHELEKAVPRSKHHARTDRRTKNELYSSSYFDELPDENDQEESVNSDQNSPSTIAKKWEESKNCVDMLMTHQNYRMGFFLVIILDTILVYSELVLGIYITETESCHCEEEIIEEFPALDPNSTIPTVLETEHTPSYDSPAQQDNGKFDCDTLAKLTRSWFALGIMTFSLLTVFFLEVVIKLICVPTLLSKKMEVVDAMLVLVSWILSFVLIFSNHGSSEQIKMVLMLTFRMLRIFNSLAFILVSYYEGLVESYKAKMHKNQVLIVKSNERRRHLAEKAMALLDEKRQLQVQYTLTSRRLSDASSAGSSSSGLRQQFADGEEDLIVEELNRARMDLHDNKQRRLTISDLDNDADYVSPRASMVLRANTTPQMGKINPHEIANAAVTSQHAESGTSSHSDKTPVLKRKNQLCETATPPSRRAKSRSGSQFHARMSNLYDSRLSIMERPSQERSSHEPSLAPTPRNSQNPFFIK